MNERSVAKPRVRVEPLGWSAYWLRVILALTWFIASIGGQLYFDIPRATVIGRVISLMVTLAPLIIVFIWLRRWRLHADEYQAKRLHYQMVLALSNVLFFPLAFHVAKSLNFGFEWPVMALPAQVVFGAVLSSRPRAKA